MLNENNHVSDLCGHHYENFGPSLATPIKLFWLRHWSRDLSTCTKGSRGERGVQYDRLIDVLTVQCHSVGLEIIGWSFSSPARSTDD